MPWIIMKPVGFCICRGWGQFLVVLIAKVIMRVQFPVRHCWWKKILHRLGCPKCVVLYQYQDLFGHRNWCRIFVPSTVWVRMCVADGFFECFKPADCLEICFLSCIYMFLIEMSQGCVFDRQVSVWNMMVGKLVRRRGVMINFALIGVWDKYSVHSLNQRIMRMKKSFTRWWFRIFFIFTLTWGRFPIWLVFLRWVETTN